MADDQKDRYIRYLAEQNWEHVLTEKAMQLVLEDFMSDQKVLKDRMAAYESQQRELMRLLEELQAELSEERKLRKSAERKVETLQEQLDYAKQECFGDRRQAVRKKAKSGEPKKTESDREDEKEGFDGTEGTLRSVITTFG